MRYTNAHTLATTLGMTHVRPKSIGSKMNSIVSIITPAYNAEKFIADTIRSVQAQTHPHWEMIIVNDCSKDGTSETVKKLATQDSRIKFIEHQQNGGPAEARNTALAHATGEYIAFLDSDDLWLPHKLRSQLEFMTKNDYAFTFTAYKRIRETNGPTGKLITVPKQIRYDGLLKNTAIATSTVMIDRKKVGPLKMVKGMGYDDFILWLDILKRGVTAYGLNEDFMRYRLVETSVSANKFKSAQWVWKIYREQEKLSLLKTFYCFINYGLRGYLKHRTF